MHTVAGGDVKMTSATVSNIIKCNTCNIVICEVLAFFQNKIDVMDEESLVNICSTNFSVEDIETAKKLLFDSVKTKLRHIARKGTGKTQRHLYDVITLFKETDPEHVPIFVAKELHKLPPINFDHLDSTRLLKDILIIQKEIKLLKNSCVSNDQLLEIKNELNNLKTASIVNNFDLNVNSKRGGSNRIESFCYDSGPVALSPYIKERNARSSRSSNEDQNIIPDIEPEFRDILTQTVAAVSPRNIQTEMQDTASESCAQASMNHTAGNKVNSVWSKSNTNEQNEGGERKDKDDVTPSEWTLIQRKRLRNNKQGSEGKAVTQSNDKFKAADIRIPLFINNVDKNTKEIDILNYITLKTSISKVTIKQINMKKQKRYNAYKIFVPHTKLSMFLNDDLWPEGIRFRRFIYFNRDNYNNRELNSRDIAGVASKEYSDKFLSTHNG